MTAAQNMLGLLARDIEKVEAQEWLRAQGLSADVSAIDFALHCMRQEGLVGTVELADEVLWNCTGFPVFWQIGRHGSNPVECCATQIRGWARVAQRSPERAARMMEDPTYSFEDALAELEGDACLFQLLDDD